MTDSFILAVIGSPFGVKGFVKVKSLSGETGHLALLKRVILRQGDVEKSYIIEETSIPEEKSSVLMKFSGIDSPEAAKTLTGAEIMGNRSQAAPLKTDEFYIEDLKGLKVVLAAKSAEQNQPPSIPVSSYPAPSYNEEILGHITDIIEGGGSDLAEIRLLSGEKKLVPFRNEFFGKIDLENNTAVLLEKWILEE